MTQDHGHDHSHDHGSELSEMQLRVRALESILLEKGYIEPAAIDELIETYEKRIGPRNGAHVVAKAWVDPAFLSLPQIKSAPSDGAVRQGRVGIRYAQRTVSFFEPAHPCLMRDAFGRRCSTPCNT